MAKVIILILGNSRKSLCLPCNKRLEFFLWYVFAKYFSSLFTVINFHLLPLLIGIYFKRDHLENHLQTFPEVFEHILLECLALQLRQLLLLLLKLQLEL